MIYLFIASLYKVGTKIALIISVSFVSSFLFWKN